MFSYNMSFLLKLVKFPYSSTFIGYKVTTFLLNNDMYA